MNRIVALLMVNFFVICGCNKKKLSEYEKLKAENDSLKIILEEIHNKYIFDSISLRDIPSPQNTYKPNSTITGEIVFVGYNFNKKSKMNTILVDSFSLNPERKLFNPDTLEIINGGFRYEKKLGVEKLKLKGLLEFSNPYGRSYEGTYFTTIKVND
ncbi:hypothetical protein OOZ15_19465 [Galbibacter sp. EGI 63066]|uniref:hypothetical protein n=1 Tax=Galbibacter sp. EGI 63066 TaxID=2993559 RepID=UPI0022492A01|nr:hypothetical protein [Galbibacter sp. EGI 63066]MCX2682134.1 hypothetical protein [Galbibacter sp. EGI 63066]